MPSRSIASGGFGSGGLGQMGGWDKSGGGFGSDRMGRETYGWNANKDTDQFGRKQYASGNAPELPNTQTRRSSGGRGNVFGFGSGSPFSGGTGTGWPSGGGTGGSGTDGGTGSLPSPIYGDTADIGTGINVIQPYSGQMTQEAVNSANQSVDQQTYMPHLMSQGQRQGVRSDASLSNIGSAMNISNMGANAKAMAGVQIPLQHQLANSASTLAGQQANAEAFIAWINNLNETMNATEQADLANNAGDFGFLGASMRGL